MVDRTQEPLNDKLTKSCLPFEFNRKKDLFLQLTELKNFEDEEIKKLQKIILDKHNKGEKFDELYEKLQYHRQESDKFGQERIDLIE